MRAERDLVRSTSGFARASQEIQMKFLFRFALAVCGEREMPSGARDANCDR